MSPVMIKSLFTESPLYMMAVFDLESIFYKLTEKQKIGPAFGERKERSKIWFYLKILYLTAIMRRQVLSFS